MIALDIPVEPATLGGMGEPTSAGAVLEAMRDRLERMGMDPALVDQAVEPEAGKAETPEDRRERLARQAANRASRWRNRLAPMYREAALADLDDAQHAVDVSYWLAHTARPHLILAGPVGTGKTHAAYAVGNAAVAKGMFVEAWTLHDLLQALRPDGDPSAQQFARTADVLILDDLGAGKVSDWAAEAFTALLDARLRSELRTVFTTNLPADRLREVWGDRAVDRMSYRALALTFLGESRRRSQW